MSIPPGHDEPSENTHSDPANRHQPHARYLTARLCHWMLGVATVRKDCLVVDISSSMCLLSL